jgi:hypothetical protein
VSAIKLSNQIQIINYVIKQFIKYLHVQLLNCRVRLYFIRNCLPTWLDHFEFSSAMNEKPCFFIFLPTFCQDCVLLLLSFFSFWLFDWGCSVSSSHYFNSHFLYNKWCWKFFHILIFHLNIVPGDLPKQILSHFWTRMIVFLLLRGVTILQVQVNFRHIICKYFLWVCDLTPHSLSKNKSFTS